jgi:hypothetical protein|tara:strand:- start:134 stop:274 length:141 start_codon:yes stop_codon:yes gene_type:complete
MIKNILNCLAVVDKSDVELINIAKGKYKYPETFKELRNAIKTIKEK